MKKLAWLVLLLWPLLAAASGPPKSYSADCVLDSGGSSVVNRIFVSGQHWRVEADGRQQVTIVLADKKLMYTLMPASRTYYEMPMSDEDASPGFKPQSPQGKVTRKLLGKEEVCGQATDKYEVMTTAPGGLKRVVYEWDSLELGVPVKMVDAKKAWSMEYRNIKVGPQDASLFQVPAGYHEFSMPKMPRLPGTAR